MKKFGYSKSEKLKQKKLINLLFETGKWKSSGKMRIISCPIPDGFAIKNAQIGVSVSKRYFKKAVERNRIKRLLRESYRLNKFIFREKFGVQCLSMLFWVSKDLPKHYSEVESEFRKLCEKKDRTL